MIEIKGLSQSYQNKKVLDQVDLFVEKDEICALVGRNGAGKSTLIHAMLNLNQVKEGVVRLGGIPHRQRGWKKLVSYLPEKFQLYPNMTGEENVLFFSSLMDEKEGVQERIENALRKVNLWEQRKELVRGYSKGMLQRLGLAVMLCFDTGILILDEPTSGLDPAGRTEFLHILRSLTNKTILFSSHHMDEIQQVCSHVAYLENGKITKYSIQDFLEHYNREGFS